MNHNIFTRTKTKQGQELTGHRTDGGSPGRAAAAARAAAGRNARPSRDSSGAAAGASAPDCNVVHKKRPRGGGSHAWGSSISPARCFSGAGGTRTAKPLPPGRQPLPLTASRYPRAVSRGHPRAHATPRQGPRQPTRLTSGPLRRPPTPTSRPPHRGTRGRPVRPRRARWGRSSRPGR